MISITCASLEAVRQNPAAYGQLLASGDGKKGGGGHGMFACVQDVARLVHLGELTVTQAVKELHNKFLRFDDTSKNKQKQDKLVEQFVKYCHQYEKQGFEFVDGWRLMKWDFTTDVRLSGRTPWVFADGKSYYGITLSEHGFDWQPQLRFPLFQQYLVSNTIDCELTDMQLGIYSFADMEFRFKSYSASEIATAIKETKAVLSTVYKEYKKSKP